MSKIKRYMEDVAYQQLSFYTGDCQHDLGTIDEDNNIELCLIGDHYRALGHDNWYELYFEEVR